MSNDVETWTESDSRIYRELAAVAVPEREQQVAALLTLLPMAPDRPCRIVELACGEGLLGEAMLRAFPAARYLGLDGSASMREATAARLAQFGERAEIAAFDLARDDWLPRIDGAEAVVSSLCIHHLDGPGKAALFRALRPRLAPGGALLIADLVEPARPEVLELFAGSWDAAVERAALARSGTTALARTFAEQRWNHYRCPDPIDRPSPLFAQLLWLKEAGYVDVDCFWLMAGHAVYGGYAGHGMRPPAGRYAEALAMARAVLGTG